jgi:hypothetical protein
VFGIRKQNANPLRHFIYVSDLKLDGLAEQIPARARREIAAELKLDLKLMSLTLTAPAPAGASPSAGRAARLALVEEHMRRSGQVGDLSAQSGFFQASAELDWLPLDDGETVVFCGYAEGLLLVLGGSISHLLGRPPAEARLGSQPYTIRTALHGGEIPRPGDLGRDLLAITNVAYVTPQSVRFSASIIIRGKLPGRSKVKEYILATPLYVETIGTRPELLSLVSGPRVTLRYKRRQFGEQGSPGLSNGVWKHNYLRQRLDNLQYLQRADHVIAVQQTGCG